MNKMSYSQIIETINSASAFDLFRLKCAIDVEMESPQKLKAIISKLRVGEQYEYFDPTLNRTIPCQLIKINKTRALVKDLSKNLNYSVPFFMLNVDSSNTDINLNSEKLSKNELSVGATVGFNHNGKDIFGVVMRLNTKTATISTTDHQRWRVPYQNLFKVINSEAVMGLLI